MASRAVSVLLTFLQTGGLQMDEALFLAMLKEARAKSGLSLDFWVDLTDGLDQSSIAILCGRSEIFPKYINSKGNP